MLIGLSVRGADTRIRGAEPSGKPEQSFVYLKFWHFPTVAGGVQAR